MRLLGLQTKQRLLRLEAESTVLKPQSARHIILCRTPQRLGDKASRGRHLLTLSVAVTDQLFVSKEQGSVGDDQGASRIDGREKV